MATVFQDTFTDTAGTLLENHTVSGGSGGPWDQHVDTPSANLPINNTGNAIVALALGQMHPTTLTPASADQAVIATLRCKALTASATTPYLTLRQGTGASERDGYVLRWNPGATTDGAGNWQLFRTTTAGSATTNLGSFAESAGGWSVGAVRTVKLEAIGSAIKVYLDGSGTPVISATDSTVTRVGVPGIMASSTQTQAGGYHWASFLVDVGGAAPVNSVAPVITGTRVVGYTLSCTTGTWSGSPSSYAYQWQRDGVNISAATASTYALVTDDTDTEITCLVTATNAGGDSTPAESNGLTILAAMINTDIQFVKGGTDGIGGTPGAVVTATGVFDNVTNPEAVAGDIEYRLVYIRNNHAIQSLTEAVAWISSQTTSSDTALAIGAATEAAGVEVPAVANESTAPVGVSFSAPATEGAGVDLGDLDAGETKGLWLRRTVTAGATPVGTDSATFNVTGTPA